MKIKKYIYGIALGALSLTYASCYNADKEFPDYEDGTTAYFAYQDPVRTVVLGNDIYDNSLDNEHKIKIWSTMGGAYGGRDAFVEIAVDETLCQDLYFLDEGGNADKNNPVTAMPSSYYKLASNTIAYNGNPRGAVEVQLTDEFFNDANSIKRKYVIPLVMKSVKGIDQILTGTPREGLTPLRQNSEDWETLPKDYVLYCVKYINPWTAKYIRRGVDKVTENGETNTYVRKDMSLINTDVDYKENPVNANDEVCEITTRNMKQAIFPVSFQRKGQASVSCNLILTFDGNKCTVSCEDNSVTATGEGEYIAKGTDLPEYKDYKWGNNNGQEVSRDILRLSYNVSFGGVITATTTDTLVVQTREQNIQQFFTPKYAKQ